MKEHFVTVRTVNAEPLHLFHLIFRKIPNSKTASGLSDSHAVPLRITVAIGYFFCYNERKWGIFEEKGEIYQ